jgi:Ferredoxin subunits of nitrite reductase and ring-hydroxylating dioxygenases
MLERWSRGLAGLGNGTAGVVDSIYRGLGKPGKALQNLLNGSWLGHSLHPVLTDVVVGGFTMLIVLDLVSLIFGANFRDASLIILGLSILAGLGAILSGLTDYKDTATGDERNVATLHGWTNIISIVVYSVAFFVRLGDGVVTGQILSIIGYLIISFGAFIGGHVVFKYGYMVNYNAFSKGRRAREFTAILLAAELPENAPTRALLGATALVLVRRGDLVYALKQTCSHAGGPLAEGTLVGDTIVCPWHASAFRLSDGAVRQGPASTRQIAYRARIADGQVEVEGPIG